MRTEFLCISVLREASEPRVKWASCKSALNLPVVCSAGRSATVVLVLVLLFDALWFVLRGDLFCVLPCVFLFLCFRSFWHCDNLAWGRESFLVLFVRFPVSILRKSISGRHRPVRVADGPMTARCRFT